MAKKPFVLSCLRILGLEEMLKLSDVVHTRSIPLKQVSGGGFAVGDAPEEKPRNEPKKEKKEAKEAKVIPFPSKEPAKKEVPEENHSKSTTNGPLDLPGGFLASEEILNQLERAKEMKEANLRHRAIEEYRQGQNTHIVKSKNDEGKTEIRFAKTKGVLIDRKLA